MDEEHFVHATIKIHVYEDDKEERKKINRRLKIAFSSRSNIWWSINDHFSQTLYLLYKKQYSCWRKRSLESISRRCRTIIGWTARRSSNFLSWIFNETEASDLIRPKRSRNLRNFSSEIFSRNLKKFRRTLLEWVWFTNNMLIFANIKLYSIKIKVK